MKKYISPILLAFLLFSCEAIFVEDISQENVVLIAPSDNSEVATGSIHFNWEGIVDATNYQIQIATPNFNQASQVVLDSIVTTTFFSKELAIGDYEWRIKASNSDYSTPYITNSFTVN
ncbi:hypothetical protein [Polaribacter vadi]|uniref:hypothetical protein n=1 Tax=Polaribacter vadi TaxID=1774273 RepID=UPI0030EB2E31|tara:strand:- start:59297 stop:59650 length:354 start_codon:yes stop_codon:yes gene_type:complete